MKAVVGVILLSLAVAIHGRNWAIIAAGSDGWGNYRHQAGACHAYQVLSDNGIPDENIVVMMYDDLAFNEENPTPGIVINQPDGPNVYENIVKDYVLEDVTAENFLKALTGDEEGLKDVGSGKVIKSGPDDNIFINLVDHGNVGIFAFPTGGYLYADDLYETIQKMKNEGKFNEMVMYMESCESGSMFDGLYPDNIGFYSTTSADPDESSYATYYDEERGTYIGDLYGVCWMENSDESDITAMTLGEQYESIKECNIRSNSMWYGQPSVQEEMVGLFLGNGKSKLRNPRSSARSNLVKKDLVKSEDVPVAILEKKMEAASGAQKALIAQELSTLLAKREFVRETTKEIAVQVTGDLEMASRFMEKSIKKVTNWDCYKASFDAYHNDCFNINKNPYALNMAPVMLNMCENGFETQSIITAIRSVCNFSEMTNIQ